MRYQWMIKVERVGMFKWRARAFLATPGVNYREIDQASSGWRYAWFKRAAHEKAKAWVRGYGHNFTKPIPGMSFYLWKFVHNALIHPMLAFPWEGPEFILKAHDWTAERCPGAG